MKKWLKKHDFWKSKVLKKAFLKFPIPQIFLQTCHIYIFDSRIGLKCGQLWPKEIWIFSQWSPRGSCIDKTHILKTKKGHISVPESLYQITFPIENDTPQGMHYAVYIMQYALCSKHYALCIMHYAIRKRAISQSLSHCIRLLFPLKMTPHKVCIMQYTLCSMHYAVSIMHYALCNKKCTLYMFKFI